MFYIIFTAFGIAEGGLLCYNRFKEGGGMKKLKEGRCEIFTTKAEAIERFIEMQGFCREELSCENQIYFYCSKDGKISVTNPPKRNAENQNSTNLFAEIMEENGKTYVTYYVSFSKANNVLKLISNLLSAIMIFLCVIVAAMSDDKKLFLASAFILAICIFRLFSSSNEAKNSQGDAEILIKELEKRVVAVNLWDK